MHQWSTLEAEEVVIVECTSFSIIASGLFSLPRRVS
jgi:hypothetical protein